MREQHERQPFSRRLQSLYGDYLAQSEKLERERRPFAGIFGLTAGPEDDPCHTRFAQELEALLEEFRQSEPSSAETSELLRAIYAAPVEHPQPRSSYWMLVAVHGSTLPLIGCLSDADARELGGWYDSTYPRRSRVPVQDRVLQALQNRK